MDVPEPTHDQCSTHERIALPDGTWATAAVDDEGIDGSSAEEPSPRFVWGQSTNFSGITDRVNPGHFVWVPKRDDDSD